MTVEPLLQDLVSKFNDKVDNDEKLRKEIEGMDKRVLAQGPEAIDRMIDRIMPVLKRRGGYIPTCDHGVPEEVSFENYCHFRNRLKRLQSNSLSSRTVWTEL